MITLTTDFGLKDSFVAEMKGVMLTINSQARFIDLCHEMSPQNMHEAAFILHTSCHYFPPGTIHLVVPNPGGGNASRPNAIQSEKCIFVEPDNGALSYVVGTRGERGEWLEEWRQAVHLSNQQYWRSKISTTFRGRDIFAPVAAHVSPGIPLADPGQSIDDLTMCHMPQPEIWSHETILADVLHVDQFGNIITNVTEHMLEHREQIQVEVAGQEFREICRAYLEVEPGELVPLIGSSGYLEISVREGNAAAKPGVQVEDRIQIRVA